MTRGSQHRCGRVGVQPPSTPSSTPYTLTNTEQTDCSIKNTRFRTYQLDHHGPRDQRIDEWTKPHIELRVRNKKQFESSFFFFFKESFEHEFCFFFFSLRLLGGIVIEPIYDR